MIGEAALTLATGRMEIAPDRLAALFDSHHQRPYRLARRLAGDADEARDLVQETFLRAARARHVPEGRSGEEAWLVRVLVNLCRDRWRQTADRRRLTLRYEPFPHTTGGDPEAALVARSMVRWALAALPPRRRAVVVMHELEGAAVPEIARSLGVRAVTVRWHLSVARRELRRILRSHFDD